MKKVTILKRQYVVLEYLYFSKVLMNNIKSESLKVSLRGGGKGEAGLDYLGDGSETPQFFFSKLVVKRQVFCV